MNILIYGSKGWIGQQFLDLLKNNNINFIEGKERENNYEDEINTYNPSHVISLIGRTHGKIDDKVYSTIDYLEQDGKLRENIKDNLYSPLKLAILCQRKNIHFTYLGTGCIFEYDNINDFIGYNEDENPNFFGSSYSIVKGFTDMLMKQFNVLNLRIRMPINSQNNPRNFITKITTYDKICSIPNSMTVLPELLPYVIKMMEQHTIGTINLTNPGVISHNEILEMYKDIVDPTFTWKNFTIEEQNSILSSKRSNNRLNTNKLESMFPDVKNIKDAVRSCLYKYRTTSYTNILVTGGCGFIGSHFINYIFDKYSDINIINYDAMYYCASEKNVKDDIINSNRYTLIKGNLNNTELISLVLEKYKIECVVHFAAQSHVQNSFYESLSYTYDNVMGTHSLLESCRIYGKIKKIIHVSTDEVYGESKIIDNKKTELSLLCPTNPYAGTKAAAELIAQTYIHSFKLPILITRGNNVYGTNQYPEKLIPKFINLLKNDKKVTIQGNGLCKRSFLHISDTVKAFDILLNKGVVGEIYNIGCDEEMEYSILDIAHILIEKIKLTKNYEEWIEYIEDRPFNDNRYYINNDKLKNLGWEIRKNFIDGINEELKI